MRPTDERLRIAVIAVLGTIALPVEALQRALAERGLDRRQLRDLDDWFQDEPLFVPVAGGYLYGPALVDGTTWTAWVEPESADEDFLLAHPHLAPLSVWFLDEVPLIDQQGHQLGVLVGDDVDVDDEHYDDVIVGPEGWLEGLGGTWVGVSAHDGAISLASCPEPPVPTERQIAAVTAGFTTAAGQTWPVGPRERALPPELRFASDEQVVFEALLIDREAFLAAPIAPLPVLYAAAGLEERTGFLAPAGFDWPALDRWRVRNRLASLHELNENKIEPALRAIEVCQRWNRQDDAALGATNEERTRTASEIAAVLADGAVAAAFWSECAVTPLAPSEVASFGMALADYFIAPPPIGVAWLAARALELEDEATAALDVLEAAGVATSDHGPAMIDLAGFRADQGHAVAALGLLQRAGVTLPEPDEDDGDGELGELGALVLDDAQRLLTEVAPWAAHRPAAAARRNDPCPCGSGRKYKACHLGREEHPLAQRADWLYEKARRYARRHGAEFLRDLAYEFADAAMSPELAWPLSDTPFVADLALHEGDLFAEFVASRSGILPADEALLAAHWELAERGLYDVLRARRHELELRSVDSGETLTVVNLTPNEAIEERSCVLVRPLPVGDAHRAFGGLMDIPRRFAPDLLGIVDEGDPIGLARALGAMFRPPTVTNTDGSEMVFHTITWRCPRPADVGQALLAAGLEPGGDDDGWTFVRPHEDEPPTILAWLNLEGDTLFAHVNSDERAGQIVALVREVLPDAELLDDEPRTLAEMTAALAPGDAGERPEPDEASQAALQEYMLDYERRWLDEAIPALGGRTPREAASDPVGREELEHLLASIPPAPPGAATMSAERIRAVLGL